jgi:nitrogen regulatory protein PII
VKIEVICKDDEWNTVVNTIVEAAKTGRIGDGKVFVSDIQHVIRIRTGESDDAAL